MLHIRVHIQYQPNLTCAHRWLHSLFLCMHAFALCEGLRKLAATQDAIFGSQPACLLSGLASTKQSVLQFVHTHLLHTWPAVLSRSNLGRCQPSDGSWTPSAIQQLTQPSCVACWALMASSSAGLITRYHTLHYSEQHLPIFTYKPMWQMLDQAGNCDCQLPAHA